MQNYKNYLLYFLIIGNAVSLVLMNRHLFDRVNKNNLSQTASPAPYRSTRKVSIAVCHPASSPTIDAIIQGFKDELAKGEHLACSYALYNNQSDPTTRDTQIKEVITTKNFDLIFTIGHGTSLKAAELARKKGSRTPIVFTAVANPVEIGVVPQDRDYSCFITGSSSQAFGQHEKRCVELLLLLKPCIKRLLIPYNPNGEPTFQRLITSIEQEVLRHDIPVQKIAFSSVLDCVQNVRNHIQEGDVILITSNPIVMAATADIAQLAFNYNALVYSLNSGGIEQGAAFGFSVDDKVSGINAGKKAREILAAGRHPADVPITPAPYNPYFWVSEEALKSPKLKIDPLVLYIIENVRLITGRGQP